MLIRRTGTEPSLAESRIKTLYLTVCDFKGSCVIEKRSTRLLIMGYVKKNKKKQTNW